MLAPTTSGSTFNLKMVQPRRPPGENLNGTGKRDSVNMSFQRKDGGSSVKGDGKTQNGARSGFRTDTAISNSRPGNERVLKRWVPDAPGDLDGSLEKSSSGTGEWDQFAANERLFGLKTDYNENYYTTAIDKSHPQYNERLASADRKAREIEKSTPTTSHVAEERVMDFVGADNGGDEEDKYSGVRRQQDFPPLSSSRENKYTPPARRAPAGHSTVTGAPVDPAIIIAQIKGGPSQSGRKQLPPRSEEEKMPVSSAARSSPAVVTPPVTTPEPKTDAKIPTLDVKQPDGKVGGANSPQQSEPVQAVQPTNEKSKPAVSGPSVESLRPAAASGRASFSPNAKPTAPLPASLASSTANSPTPPSAADGVEKALLKEFKNFASQERINTRINTEKARTNKIRADAQVKLQELKKFATNFKLSTPVPKDLIPIIAKDPAKQKQIQEKALQNIEEIAKTKAEAKVKDAAATSPSSTSKASNTPPASGTGTTSSAVGTVTPANTSSTTGSGAATDKPAQANNRPHGPVHGGSPSVSGRHPNSRPPYMQQNYRQQSQGFRSDHRSGGQHMSQGPGTGHLAERLRNNMDQTRYPKQQAPHTHYNAMGDMRAPPTGPANPVDPSYSRRLSALTPGVHGAQKLNPTTHEFRPSPFAASFSPAGPSTGSSPRSAINNMSESIHPNGAPSTAPTIVTASSPRASPKSPIRRKVKAVDPKKCQILDHILTLKPPPGRNWDDNEGLRPSYDTPPTWRQLQDDEKADSTMQLTYKEYFERQAFTAASIATPIAGHALPHGMPQMAQHQMPYNLQQHGGHMGPRPAHMPPMPMHVGGGPHGPASHMQYNGNDDHRMMHSNSAQSYASSRMTQVPMYPQQVGGTPQMAFNQPVMPFIQNTPQMNNFRNYPNTPQQYMSPQSGPMMSMMPPQPFVAVPGGIMPPGQQMPVYPGPHPYMQPPGATGGAGGVPPPQALGGANGYPSPGRPVAAPLMAQQGSQQGQPPMYGMSPSMQYQQPAFGPQHPGQGGPMRGGYNNSGSQHFGTSPQQMHQYGPPHRNGSGNYGGKNYQNHNHNSHQGPPPHHPPPPSSGHQSRAGGDVEETK